MKWLTEIIGGNIGALFKEIMGTIKLSPEAKAEVELKLQENAAALKLKQMEMEEAAEQRVAAEIDAKKEIMLTELKQDDKYTKRARPTIIYSGLGYVFLNYCLFPTLAFFTRGDMPSLEIPSEFWWIWGGVCGVYVFARSKYDKATLGKPE